MAPVVIEMSVAVEKITEPLLLGEGPHWDELQQALYFVNILGHTIHKYVPETGAHTKTNVGGRVGFIVPVEGTSDQFVIGVERTFLVVRWDGVEGSPATVEKEIREIDAGTRNRLNDGKADPRGRLFAGTMGHEDPPGNYELNKGSLYRVEGTRVSQVADQVGISNGLAWDLKEKALYYIDSMERKVRRYDYNVDSALITKPTYVFDFDKNNLPDCFPDGCTIDTDGNLWVAVFDGSCVIKVDPRTGKLLQKLEIPAKQVTSVTFGGPNYDVLFVTSASMNIKGPQEPPCGCVFKVTGLGVRGLPNYSFKL